MTGIERTSVTLQSTPDTPDTTPCNPGVSRCPCGCLSPDHRERCNDVFEPAQVLQDHRAGKPAAVNLFGPGQQPSMIQGTGLLTDVARTEK